MATELNCMLTEHSPTTKKPIPFSSLFTNNHAKEGLARFLSLQDVRFFPQPFSNFSRINTHWDALKTANKFVILGLFLKRIGQKPLLGIWFSSLNVILIG